MNPAGSAYLLLLVTISTNSSPAPALGKLQTSGKTNIFNRNFVTNDPIISVFNSQDVRRGGDGDESRSQHHPSPATGLTFTLVGIMAEFTLY